MIDKLTVVAYGLSGEPELRGAGVVAAKSALLLSVSTQPEFPRNTAVVLVVAGAGPAPSKKFAPSRPSRSTTVASWAGGHGVELPLQPSGVVELTSATLPPVPLMLIGVVSMTSGVGSGDPTAAFVASCTSRYWPGASEPDNGVIRLVADPKLPVPTRSVYWIDQPARSTVVVPRLKSSTKSWVYVAPSFRPRHTPG